MINICYLQGDPSRNNKYVYRLTIYYICYLYIINKI